MIRTYLNNLIAWELQERDIGGVTSHEIAIQDSQDAFVGNNQQVILLTLKFEDYRFKTDSEVMIGLS